jgi:signal transduction histidine kinase
MRSLFMKIFVWFWVAMVLVSATLILSVAETQTTFARASKDQKDCALTPLLAAKLHGEGVPQQALEKMFRPFYVVDEARRRSAGRVGLGLTITERAVSLHGGQVKAENSPFGWFSYRAASASTVKIRTCCAGSRYVIDRSQLFFVSGAQLS